MSIRVVVVALVIVAALAITATAGKNGARPRMPSRYLRPENHPGVENCTVMWHTQFIDHFGWGALPEGLTTYQQRYFICNQYWKGDSYPIFFYTGNEANVELYINMTGLMWENAPAFNALLIFAEHRYFGESLPFGEDSIDYMDYLSSEQALADYATLITDLRTSLPAPNSAIIGFGGSYGGMLVSWLRMKYPNVIDGCIAGSAPIVDFLNQGYDEGSFGAAVTFDASSAGGGSDVCVTNIRDAWQAVFNIGQTESGRTQLQQSFKMCDPIETEDNVTTVAEWAEGAFDYLAMGSYPFPSTYMTNGGLPPLPPYPMRYACGYIEGQNYTDVALVEALADAFGVFMNYTGTLECYDMSVANNATTQDGLFWDYLACTEFVMPASRDGVHDMFWPQPWDLNEYILGCQQQWNVTPRAEWPNIVYGGWNITAASNIIFSNGQLDPWLPGGITKNLTSSLLAIIIPDVGHHIDLMFSNPADTPAVTAARQFELGYISQWIQEVADKKFPKQ